MITLAFWSGFVVGAVVTLVVVEMLTRPPTSWRELDARTAVVNSN